MLTRTVATTAVAFLTRGSPVQAIGATVTTGSETAVAKAPATEAASAAGIHNMTWH
ncbi:hypothetical protein [Streptomyces sp. NRRL F-2664]|uniref:hypothetical protein n=1 Tax=Streptomyces sp. NRRL F-2664 TaxID=1463842 RepID=UPI000A4EC962|nr:hypothetical protein [Streptomyces sp. NRRL F-2664]